MSGDNKRPTDLTLRKYHASSGSFERIMIAFIPQKHFGLHQYPDYPWQDRA